MNYKKLFGFGILIWGTAFIVASIFVGIGLIDSLISSIIIPLAVGIVAYFAGKNLKLKSTKEILKYSIPWVVIALVLDVIVTVPFTGWSIFTQWDVLLGYTFILVIPLFGKGK